MGLWLAQRYVHQGFNVGKLAAALNVSHAAVGHWTRGHHQVLPKYWPAIATFFGYDAPDAILSEARTLHRASAR